MEPVYMSRKQWSRLHWTIASVYSQITSIPGHVSAYIEFEPLTTVRHTECEMLCMGVIAADPARSTGQHCGHWGAKQHKSKSILSNILLMTATQTIVTSQIVNWSKYPYLNIASLSRTRVWSMRAWYHLFLTCPHCKYTVAPIRLQNAHKNVIRTSGW